MGEVGGRREGRDGGQEREALLKTPHQGGCQEEEEGRNTVWWSGTYNGPVLFKGSHLKIKQY